MADPTPPRRFSHFLAIDWSGAHGERQKGIALAIADAAGGAPVLVRRGKAWSRAEVMAILRDSLPPDTLVGMDLGIALPHADCGAYFPGDTQSPPDARSLWALIDATCGEYPHLGANGFVTHPRFAPYFRHSRDHVGDHFHHPNATNREGRFRRTEDAQRQQGVRPVSNFNLVGAAQVGKSSLTGMRMLHRLRDHVLVWPMDSGGGRKPVIVEIYTSIAARSGGVSGTKTKLRSYEELNQALIHLGSPAIAAHGPIDDHSSDALVAAAWLRSVADDAQYWHPNGLTEKIARTEGWTFGSL